MMIRALKNPMVFVGAALWLVPALMFFALSTSTFSTSAYACGGGSSGGDSSDGSEGSSGTDRDGGKRDTDQSGPPEGFNPKNIPWLRQSSGSDNTSQSGTKTKNLVETINKIGLPESPTQPASGLSDRDKMMERAWKVRQRDLYMLAAAQAERDALFWTRMKKGAEYVKQGAEYTNFVLGFFVPAGQTARLGYKALEKAGAGLKGYDAYAKALLEGATNKQALGSAATAVALDLGMSQVSAAQIQKVANKQVALGMLSQSIKAQKAVQVTVQGFLGGATKATTNMLEGEANNAFRGEPNK